MNGHRLAALFRKWKKEANADYAITNPDKYGDCCNCVLCELGNRFGKGSTGIWTLHWKHDGPYEEIPCVYVYYEMTDEQIELFYEIFSKYYEIKPDREHFSPKKLLSLRDLHD